MLLLTGASGFLGRKVVEILTAKKIPFRCFGRTRVGESFVKGDITNKSDVAKALDDVDVVIHMAAPFSPKKNVNYSVIVDGMRNLIGACTQNNARIVFVSSWAAARNNKDHYGFAKLEAEQILEASGLNHSIVRPSLIFGKGGIAFEKILKTLDFPVVPIIGKGEFLVGPVFVDDVAEIVVNEALSDCCRKFSIVGDLLRYDEFVKRCLAVSGRSKQLVRIPYFVCWIFSSTVGRLVGFPPATLRRSIESVFHADDHFSNFFEFELTPLKEGLRKSIIY